MCKNAGEALFAFMRRSWKCCSVANLSDAIFLQEVLVIVLIAVEHVDIDIAMNTAYSAIGTQLPDAEFDFRLVLAVTGNPDKIVALNVGGKW